MHRITHDTRIEFSAPKFLADAIANEAAQRGMNLSEFLRSIVREKVGLN